MYTIGIDVGGTSIVAGVVDDSCKILAKAKVPTAPERGVEAVVADMGLSAAEAAAKAGLAKSDITWLGIGSPGVHSKKDGTLVYACNIPYDNTPVVSMLQKSWDCPVYIENDANAAALGEAYAGAASDARHAVMLTLGTGLGGGIIIDKRVYAGFNDAGGELGHMVIVKDGAACTCGRKGCWEAYASATGLIRLTKEIMGVQEADGMTAFKAMYAGDAKGKAAVDAYMGYLVSGMGSIINIFQPEAVVLGGGVSHEGQILLDMIDAILWPEVYTLRGLPKPTVRLATLGNDAGIIGAAMLGK